MTVHLVDWRDLPALHRFRNQSVYLDSSLVLTRGTMLMPGALLSSLAPATGVFTAVSNGKNHEQSIVFGQVIHLQGWQFARLTFLTPDDALSSETVSPLLEYLITLCGQRGALRMIAEVDDQTLAFDALHAENFVIYARQRIWKFAEQPLAIPGSNPWQTAVSQDVIEIRSLCNNLVPGLVQQMEPYSAQNPRGLVYYQRGTLLAYADLKYGHRGVWVQPFIHPAAEDVSEQLAQLFWRISSRHTRPVYLCVRSYQSWLEPILESLGGQEGPRQAVIARHLAIAQKAARPVALPAREAGQPEVTAPIAQSE